MRKLIKQLEQIENVPKEAVDLANLIYYKQCNDKILTKFKIEILFENIYNLEKVLKLNNIKNEIVNREIKSFKDMLYDKQDFFKNQEKLLAS